MTHGIKRKLNDGDIVANPVVEGSALKKPKVDTRVDPLSSNARAIDQLISKTKHLITQEKLLEAVEPMRTALSLADTASLKVKVYAVLVEAALKGQKFKDAICLLNEELTFCEDLKSKFEVLKKMAEVQIDLKASVEANETLEKMARLVIEAKREEIEPTLFLDLHLLHLKLFNLTSNKIFIQKAFALIEKAKAFVDEASDSHAHFIACQAELLIQRNQEGDIVLAEQLLEKVSRKEFVDQLFKENLLIALGKVIYLKNSVIEEGNNQVFYEAGLAQIGSSPVPKARLIGLIAKYQLRKDLPLAHIIQCMQSITSLPHFKEFEFNIRGIVGEFLYELAQYWIKKSNYDEARSSFKGCASRLLANPDEAEIMAKALYCCSLSKDEEVSVNDKIVILEKVVKLQYDSVFLKRHFHFALANFLIKRNNEGDAAKAIELLDAYPPKSNIFAEMIHLYSYGVAFKLQGKREKALEYLCQARAKIGNNKPEEVLALFRKIIELINQLS